MKRIRKAYDTAFKQQAVELAKERTNKSELALELGIRPPLLYKWCKESHEFGISLQMQKMKRKTF